MQVEDFKDLRLDATTNEREKYESLSELYAILVSLEHVEKGFVRDSINSEEYTPACRKLLSKYKTLFPLIEQYGYENVEKFMAEYNLNFPLTLQRLRIGVPATIEHGTDLHGPQLTSKVVAETVQYFITFMDSLKIGMKAVDELHPLLSDVLDGLNKIPFLPVDFSGKVKLREWLTKLNEMKASDELSEEQMRQLSFEIENAYQDFHRALSDK